MEEDGLRRVIALGPFPDYAMSTYEDVLMAAVLSLSAIVLVLSLF